MTLASRGVFWGQAAERGSQSRPRFGLVFPDLRHRGKPCDQLRPACVFLSAKFGQVGGKHPVRVPKLASAVQNIPNRERGTARGLLRRGDEYCGGDGRKESGHGIDTSKFCLLQFDDSQI